MWLYTSAGFFSVVADYKDSNKLVVRARCKEDINKMAAAIKRETGGRRPKVKRTPGRDYIFRLTVDRQTFGVTMARMAAGIDYTNFKNSVHGDFDRDRAYMDCWSAMNRFQNNKLDRTAGQKLAKGWDELFDDDWIPGPLYGSEQPYVDV